MNLPPKGTPEYEVIICAMEVACYPPMNNDRNQATAQVSWRRIKELRAALDAAGLPWREAKAISDKNRAEAARQQRGGGKA